MRTEKARKIMKKGGIVVYPTETAYGIGCNALDEEAVEKIYEAKQRPREKGLTVICSSLEQVEKYGKLTKKDRKLVGDFMPGPLTLIVDKKQEVPGNLNESFVFRISSSETARELAKDFPLVATSANISGNNTSYSVEEISDDLLDSVDLVLDEGDLEKGPTSTIARVDGEGVEVLREGPITLSELKKSLSDGN